MTELSSRFVIPCGNFLAGFSKLGFKAIQNLFIKNGVNFSEKTIKNSYTLISDFEKMDIKKTRNTLVSFDVQSMYPSCRHSYIKKAILHFSKDFSADDKEKVLKYWDTCKFGMRHVLLRHRDEYFEFRGCDATGDDPGLAIGSYESAFFADLTMAYLFEKLKTDFGESCSYWGIYRDDAVLVFNGVKSSRRLKIWHQVISAKIAKIMPDIKFTMTEWDDDGLAFLDIFLFWDDEGELSWKTYKKENSVTKYLNSDSPGHSKTCKTSIPDAVFGRLANLTKKSKTLSNTRVSDHYPEHTSALKAAGLCRNSSSPLAATFGQKWGNSEVAEIVKNSKKRRIRPKNRTIYFVCSYFGRFLKEPIHKILKRLRDYHGVKWLRARMAYTKFASMESQVQGDLQRKVDKGIAAKEFVDWPCNCTKNTKNDKGLCMFDGKCRKACLIYSFRCRICDSEYIGSTQRFIKKRLNEHCGDVVRKVKNDVNSDTFCKHWAEHRLDRIADVGWGDPDEKEIQKIRRMVDPKIIWQGNSAVVARSFGTDRCRLCDMEKYYIFERRRDGGVINQNSDFYSSCRHKPRIQHLFTDEA